MKTGPNSGPVIIREIPMRPIVISPIGATSGDDIVTNMGKNKYIHDQIQQIYIKKATML